MRSCVFVRCKNELNIREFIEYYISKLEFDHVIIYDDFSDNNVKQSLNDVSTSILTVINPVHFENYDQTSSPEFYDIVLLPYIQDFDFCLHSDMDEYLVLQFDKTIKHFLNKYTNIESLRIPWIFFSNNHNKYGDESTLINQYIYCSKYYKPSSMHYKTLAKVSCIKGAVTTHEYILKENSLTKFSLNMKEYDLNMDIQTHVSKIPMFIAHFYTTSISKFIDRKILTPYGLGQYSYKMDPSRFDAISPELAQFCFDNITEVINWIYNDSYNAKFDDTNLQHYKQLYYHYGKNMTDKIKLNISEL